MIQVLYSAERPLLISALKKLLKTSLPKRDALNYMRLDMLETKLATLADEASYLPLGYDKKAVVADNFLYLAKPSKRWKAPKGDDEAAFFASLASLKGEAVLLYLLVPSEGIDEKSRFYKALKEADASFSPVRSFSLEDYAAFARRFLNKRGLYIDERALNELIRRAGSEYQLFRGSLEKLSAYAEEGEITLEAVQTLIAEPAEENAYALLKALAHGDKAGAYRIWQDLERLGGSAVPLLYMLGSEWRFIGAVGVLRKEGYDASSIARELNARPSWKVQNALETLRLYGLKKVRSAEESVYSALLSVMKGESQESLAFATMIASFPER